MLAAGVPIGADCTIPLVPSAVANIYTSLALVLIIGLDGAVHDTSYTPADALLAVSALGGGKPPLLTCRVAGFSAPPIT